MKPLERDLAVCKSDSAVSPLETNTSAITNVDSGMRDLDMNISSCAPAKGHNRNFSYEEEPVRRSPLEGYSEDYNRLAQSMVTTGGARMTEEPTASAVVPRKMMAPTMQRPASASFAT